MTQYSIDWEEVASIFLASLISEPKENFKCGSVHTKREWENSEKYHVIFLLKPLSIKLNFIIIFK